MWTKFRLLSLLAAFSFALNLSATTFDYNADGTQTQTIDGITIKLEKGGNASNAPAYSSYNGMKLYANNTITVDATQAFKNIQLVFSKNEGKDYLPMTASVGELTSGGTSTALDDKKIDVWNGETTHLVFTLGTKGQRVIYQIVVDGDPIELNPVNYVDDTPLDPDFAYGEPTAILCPEKLFSKKEYAFIESNIRVHCTQGAIIDTASTPYFNCNAGFSLSFEATQPIKGIVINGAVRKLFSCSVDKGEINFLSPDEFYEEDYQECASAVVITDVNDTKVTISCEKQLRCYSVWVYFDANPEQSVLDCEEGTQEGEVFFLNFDSADAVYEEEFSKETGKTNYSVFLYNQADEKIYLALDLYPTAVNVLEGQYIMEEETLGDMTYYQFGEDQTNDITWMLTDGAVVVNKSGDVYSINGYITCDDHNTYNFSFTGKPKFFTDNEYYAEGIENIPVLDRNAPMYDILGRKINDTYRGIVIQEGHKYLLK